MIKNSNTFYNKIINEANKFAKIGVKYKHRGTTINGCDCTGLLICVAKNIGYMNKFKLRNYSLDWNLHSGAGDYIIQGLNKIGEEIPKSTTQPGDILVFKFGRCDAHIGILVNDDLFVHSYFEAKKCKYGRLKNSDWFKRWTRTFRLDENKMLQYN